MFIGHYAVALGAKRAAPRASLGILVVAAQFLDLVWPVLLLVGWEQVRIVPSVANPFLRLEFVRYPYTHSLLAAAAWAAAFGGAVYLWKRSERAALVVALLVISHWVLDWISHVPDLPLAPGASVRVGLGLWRSPLAALAVEVAMFVAGAFLYDRATRPRDRLGAVLFWAFVVGLLAIEWINFVGPPPPDVSSIAGLGLPAGWLLVAWAWWLDRHRIARS
ncbi:MAG: metal-dependent hydrolase [Betaproteobacteria bacterium]